jgi:cbb3-type cytochrome oxidase maturation protein
MEILFVLIPLSVVLVAIAIGAFVWAANSGQFDAADEAAARVLRDDGPPAP